MKLKKCTGCLQEKDINDFGNLKRTSDGKQFRCKPCKKNEDAALYIKQKEQRLEKSRSYYENNKEKVLTRRKGNEKYAEYNKKYYDLNKETYAQYRKDWRSKNKEWIREYSKNRLITNPLAKLAKQCRARLRELIKSKGYTKSKRMNEYIGCSIQDLKSHIETQSQPGMTWENHGEWHIDHIYPLSLAKDENELYKLCHYTNLQPLWASENLSKNNRVCL